MPLPSTFCILCGPMCLWWCLETETWLPHALYKVSLILLDLSRSGMAGITCTVRNNILLYFKIPPLLLCNVRSQVYSLVSSLFFLRTVFSCPNFTATAPFQQDSCRVFFSSLSFSCLDTTSYVHPQKKFVWRGFCHLFKCSFRTRNTSSLFNFNWLIRNLFIF